MTLITLEGLDGSGTTTALESIKRRYPSAVTTTEPTDRRYGQLLRENLADDESNELVNFYLFMADRVDHIESVIEPADTDNKLVVCDRYSDSTRVYQPVSLTGDDKPFDSQWHAKHFIEKSLAPWDYEPDLTLYLDVSVDTAIERSDGSHTYEEREFLEQVRQNYEALVESNDRIVRIDAERPMDQVERSVLGKIGVISPDRL
jgi:dTMP kinase